MRRTTFTVAFAIVLAGPFAAAQQASDVAQRVAALRDTEAGYEAWESVVAAGRDAVPELRKALSGPDERMRACSAALLYRLGEADALDALATLVEAKNAGARAEAVAALRAYVGGPLLRTGAADGGVGGWKAWWAANAKQVKSTAPLSRLYGRVTALDGTSPLAVVGLASRHGARKGMTLTVRRGAKAVCSLVILHAGPERSVARVVELSSQTPPRVGDVVFYIRR